MICTEYYFCIFKKTKQLYILFIDATNIVKNTEMCELPLRWEAREEMGTVFSCIYNILFL